MTTPGSDSWTAASRSGRPAPAAPAPRASGGASTFGLGLSGRIGRLRYATAGVWLLAVMVLLAWWALMRPSGTRLALAGLVYLGLLVVALRLSVLRCHDINRSGWWSLLMLVPYLDLVVGLVLSFLPGTADDNDFGEAPPAGSWALLLASAVALAVLLALTLPGLLSAATRAIDANDDAAAADGSPRLSRQGLAAYHGPYQAARPFKAFVASADGPWGWKGGAVSLDDAIAAATAHCESHRKASAAPCLPIDLNGAPASSR